MTWCKLVGDLECFARLVIPLVVVLGLSWKMTIQVQKV